MKTLTVAASGLVLAFVAALSADAQETRLDQMVQAALHGPELKKVKYIKHEFNVKKARITYPADGVTRIEGQLSHHLSFRPDDQFYYTIEKKRGHIISVDFKIDRGGLAPYVGKLAKEIPIVGVAHEEIEQVIRKLGQKVDGSWESEAELIALAIAMRVDPETRLDLVRMFKQGKRVDLLAEKASGGAAKQPMKAPRGAGVLVRDRRK